MKTGVSGGKITKKNTSYRGNAQANKWNREEGTPGRYKSDITNKEKAGPGARETGLKYEKNRADMLRENNELDPKKHVRP